MSGTIGRTSATMRCWRAWRNGSRPICSGMMRRAHLANLDLMEALLARLDWKQRHALDELAPTHLTVPSGSRVPLDYQSGEVPVLAVRLQEMFGATDTPTVAGGKAQVLLHLLSPARRPVQVTRDLKSFWANSYRAVKSDLKGQFPSTIGPTTRCRPSRRRGRSRGRVGTLAR